VSRVSCGFNYTVILTDSKEVWSMGMGRSGQLGLSALGYLGLTCEPQKVSQIDTKIMEISAGFAHVLAVSQKGTAFSWGNCGSRLGYRRLGNQTTPKEILIPLGDEGDEKHRVEDDENSLGLLFSIPQMGRGADVTIKAGRPSNTLDARQLTIENMMARRGRVSPTLPNPVGRCTISGPIVTL